MHYIVALGNPGEKYKDTRHNVGWMAVDHFLGHARLPEPIMSKSVSGRQTDGLVQGKEVKVLYPETFMNNSGSAVVKLVPKNEVANLIVVHDEIDLPFGEIKVSHGRGAGGNNGVSSIVSKLDSRDFVRIRVGIAPKSIWTGKVKRPAGGGPLERFVLKSFSPSESKHLPEIFEKVQLSIESILVDGVDQAMNKTN